MEHWFAHCAVAGKPLEVDGPFAVFIEADGLRGQRAGIRVNPTVLEGGRCQPSGAAIELARVATGTVPRVAELIWVPVSVPGLTLAAVIALFFTFGVVTAFFFSCFGPTVFLPRVDAAIAPPPRAVKRAIVATTFA